MKIMQIAPFGLPIRSDIRYGGIEQVIEDLDNQFVEKKQESFVVATEDSIVKGTLCPTLSKSSWISQKDKKEGWKYEKDVTSHDKNFETHCSRALEQIIKIKPDIIHDHLGFIRSEAFQRGNNLPPILTTLHGPLNKANLQRFKNLKEKIKGKKVYFNSISESQKRSFTKLINVDYVILNAVDIANSPYQSYGEGYVFSMGLISPAKGTDIALDVAKKLNKKIVIAGPIHHFVPEINEFWEKSVKPKLDKIIKEEIYADDVEDFIKEFKKSSDNSVYIGEVNKPEKRQWFKRADVFYLPIRWQEPFGLIMVESMACGTPVIAYAGGAVPEVIEHNKTGYVVEQGNFNSFVNYASQINKIKRKNCRNHIKENFTISRQADDYINAYRDIINRVN